VSEQSDELRLTFRIPLWYCRVCDCLVSKPEDHQYHAVIRMTADDPMPTLENPAPIVGAGRGPT